MRSEESVKPRALIEATGLKKNYLIGTQNVSALKDVSITVPSGEFVCVMGKSGSGKSTLLHIIGALDQPDAGKVTFQGQELGKLSDSDLAAFRRRKIGFIFQFFNLMPTLTALESVALPLLLDGVNYSVARDRATELLIKLDLGSRLDHRPGQLSGGQMQRVAIARALVAKPSILLADEPTGNLDSALGLQILEVFRELAKKDGQTILMVTHDPGAAEFASRVITMKDGQIESDVRT